MNIFTVYMYACMRVYILYIYCCWLFHKVRYQFIMRVYWRWDISYTWAKYICETYTTNMYTHTTDTIIAVKASTCIYDRINPRKYQVQWHKCGLINTSERLRLRIKSRRAISPKDRSSPIYGLLIYMALVKTLSRSKL